MSRHGIGTALLALGAAAALAGCGAVSPSAKPSGSGRTTYTSIVITRRSKIQQLAPLRKTVTSGKTIAAFLKDLHAIRQKPKPFTYMCPVDFGVSYRLAFKGTGSSLVATASSSGCRFIKLSTGEILWSGGPSGKAFWSLLGRTLGLSSAQLER